jgi:general secretion pathway protein K
LARDRQNSETDHPGEEWANLPLALPIESGTITSRVSDLQGCFNLNNLWRPAPGGQSAVADSKQERPPRQGEKGKSQKSEQESAERHTPKTIADPAQVGAAG